MVASQDQVLAKSMRLQSDPCATAGVCLGEAEGILSEHAQEAGPCALLFSAMPLHKNPE